MLKAGLEARRNHSLRATAATTLFKANVPKKVIQERTGHRSIDALRLYERSNEDQYGAASRILALGKEVEYHKAVCPVSPSHEKASKGAVNGSSTASTTGLSIILNIQSMTVVPLIYPMAIHQRPSKSILWHYRSSQKKRSKNFSATSDFPSITIIVRMILMPMYYV